MQLYKFQTYQNDRTANTASQVDSALDAALVKAVEAALDADAVHIADDIARQLDLWRVQRANVLRHRMWYRETLQMEPTLNPLTEEDDLAEGIRRTLADYHACVPERAVT